MNRPAEYGSFPTYSKPKCVKIEKKKASNLGYCYYCTYKGEKVHLSKILPDCSRKKTFSLCGHDWEHMWTTPHLAQPLPVPSPSLSPLPLSVPNQKETKQNLVFPSQSWQGSLQWINYLKQCWLPKGTISDGAWGPVAQEGMTNLNLHSKRTEINFNRRQCGPKFSGGG